MRFIVLVHPGDMTAYEGGAMPSQELLMEMGKFNEELIKAGVMQAGDGFHPSSKGVRIKFHGKGRQEIKAGPFPENEVIGGYWIWQVKSKDEAVAWAKRAPMEDGATLELRQAFEPEDFG